MEIMDVVTKELLIQKQFEGINWPISFALLEKGDLVSAATAILGMVAIKTNLMYFLTEECRDALASFLNRAQKNAPKEKKKEMFLATHALRHSFVELEETPPLVPSESKEPVKIEEEDLMSFFSFEKIRTGMVIPNKYMTFSLAIKYTNLLIHSIRNKNQEGLREIVEYMAKSPEMDLTYSTGSVRVKTPHTFLVPTKGGPVQVGIPADTVKDSMQSGDGVPQIYVLPSDLFTFGTDETFAEVEFPIYFNFFVGKGFLNPSRRVIIIGNEEHLNRVRTLFQESIFGPSPDEIFVDEEIAPERKAEGYSVDLEAEMKELRWRQPDGRKVDMDLFVDFHSFSGEDRSVKLDMPVKGGEEGETVEIKITCQHGLLRFYEENARVASLGMDFTPHVHTCRERGGKTLRVKDDPPTDAFSQTQKVFSPPPFGLTFLGTGHGFDVSKSTTGFIVWVKGRGIAVDPPIGTIEYLRKKGIPLKYISKAVLTHVHADHDGGLLQLIMAGQKIEVFTTKTVHRSYLRKLKAVTGIENVSSYYYQRQVLIGSKENILGATFEFDYSYHSIPTVRFYCSFGGRSVAYSADTFYDPAKYSELRQKGVFSQSREMSLSTFLWSADIVIHENGVPPIHTSAEVLNALPSNLKKKILIVHTSGLPKEVKVNQNGKELIVPVTGLRIPPCGLDNTVSLPVSDYLSGFCSSLSRLVLISNIPFFKEMPPQILLDVLSEAEERVFGKGDVVVKEGESSDSFYIIESGHCEVVAPNNDNILLQMGDIFGESVFQRTTHHRNRQASIVVSSESCTLLVLPSSSIDRMLEIGGVLEQKLDVQTASLSTNRKFAQTILANTFTFQGLTLDQLNLVAAALGPPQSIPAGTTLIQKGEQGTSMFVVESGILSVVQPTTFSLHDVSFSTSPATSATPSPFRAFLQSPLFSPSVSPASPPSFSVSPPSSSCSSASSSSSLSSPRSSFTAPVTPRSLNSSLSRSQDTIPASSLISPPLPSSSPTNPDIPSLGGKEGKGIGMGGGGAFLFPFSSPYSKEAVRGVKEVTRLGAGSVVGEMSLLTGAERNATIIALEDSVVFELTKEKFVALLEENQTIRLHVLFMATRRASENKRITIAQNFANATSPRPPAQVNNLRATMGM